jgi:two-component system chemotaxis sensor kinase CheA
VARDPYKYFRIEARELLEGLSRGALDLEKGVAGAEQVVQMLRLAHTLKGAARVVGQLGIARVAHTIEETLGPHRQTARGGVPREHTSELLRLLDEVDAGVEALEAPVAPIEAGTAEAAPEPMQSVRIDIGEMDSLLEGVFETEVRLGDLRSSTLELGRARALAASLSATSPTTAAATARGRATAEEIVEVLGRVERNLSAGLDAAGLEIAQVRDRAGELRLVAARTIFAPLERAVRDAAHALGKSVEFATSGGEHRVEANVLLPLRDALLHVVRNAVAHGIESAAERSSRHKPPTGRVRLDVQRRGSRIAFLCRDDGRGVDVEAVRHAAVARGVLTAPQAAALDAPAIVRLVLESGLTTSETVTDVAGRGIGLDVLRSTAARLEGEVRLTSEAGLGTAVEVSVPVSLASVVALVLEAGGGLYAVSLDAARRAVRLEPGDVARSATGDSVVVDGTTVPFLSLAAALGAGSARRGRAGASTAVVLRAGDRDVALGVDRLVGTARLVLRPVPRLAGHAALVAGTSLDADGNPQLVLDPRALVDAAHAGRFAVDPSPPAARAPVLVIDDSPTTRMLEQSILESAGYGVDLATSAEEALAKARARSYSLFLVDVEMPGMDGFAFVEQTRADPALRAIPSILVTSRSSADDRRRGEEAGAHAYIVKGEFDQTHLLTNIRRLIG